MLNKIVKVAAIVCVSILLLEGCYLIYRHFNTESKTTYYDGVNALYKLEDGYIGVGSGDFKYSKKNSYTNGYEKAKLVKYDKDMNIVFEKKFDEGFNTMFFDVVAVSDGYIAVGAGEFSEEQHQNQLTDALVVKYDLNGNLVYKKTFQELADANFYKVKLVEDGFLAIGQSIYAPMELGNATTGGGMVVKYDFDGNEVWRSNFGGNKSGIFSDGVIVDDALYLVGRDSSNTGLLVKMDLNGTREWIRNYNYTDQVGFSAVAYYEGALYIAGAKKTNPDNDRDYASSALVVSYDLNGTMLKEVTLGGEVMERFNSIMVDENGNLVAVGQKGTRDAASSTATTNVYLYDGIMAKYTSSLKEIYNKEIKGSKNDYLSWIMQEDHDYIVISYTQSHDHDFKDSRGNGKDYFAKFIIMGNDGVIKKIH